MNDRNPTSTMTKNTTPVVPAPVPAPVVVVAPATTSTTATTKPPRPAERIQQKYYSIVIDSGPIIKNEIENLIGKANKYVTTPTVISEIRDASSRQYLQTLMLNPNLGLEIRPPTEKSIQSMIAFSKQTGDYASLSTIDLHVLALTLDMEKEGCSFGSVSGSSAASNVSLLDHIRTTPKRKIGLGSILPMNNKQSSGSTTIKEEEEKKGGDKEERDDDSNDDKPQKLLGKEDYDEVEHESDDDDGEEEEVDDTVIVAPPIIPVVKSSWANLANPGVIVAVDNANIDDTNTAASVEDTTTASTFASMHLKLPLPSPFTTASKGRISASAFAIVPPPYTKDKYGNELDIVEDDAKNEDSNDGGVGQFDDASESEDEDEVELELEFPSLLAASTVPYEGEDNDNNDTTKANLEVLNEEIVNNEVVVEEEETKKTVFLTDEEKAQNLSRVSKSGRSYNSFRKYKGLMKPKQPTKKKVTGDVTISLPSFGTPEASTNTMHNLGLSSKIIGGGGMGGETMFEKDDDGTGWITSTQDIKLIKNESGGRLDPGKCLPTVSVTDGAVATDGAVTATATSGSSADDGGITEGAAATSTEAAPSDTNSNNTNSKRAVQGPPLSQRSACVTTDFAMQNVLLQMNLHLLSTDNGMRIKRLKSWVIRCGACFKIHGADDEFKDDSHHYMKRLFCSHCGSGDMMQRISASVDGKTGRLKLHFSKRKQGRIHSIRGTKFSLPKSGVGKHNRFKGDLLLREDQLLSGVWNQKVKINSGNKYQTSKSHSIFGRDIASSVGCNVKSTSSAKFGGKGWSGSGNTSGSGIGNSVSTDDIKVGFGARKNPNAAKGRERRGKKKTSHDRACGMRRY